MEKFVTKARAKHGDKYDYSLVEYKGNEVKVTIICREHGPFEQIPKNHTNKGSGCPKCSYKKPRNPAKTTEVFISEVEAIYAFKYDYSKTLYKNNTTDVIVGCKVHGDFTITPIHFIKGHGCKKCSNTHRRTFEDFVLEAQVKHKNLYAYDLVSEQFITTTSSVPIVCSKHGTFTQKVQHHLNGAGCPRCKHSKGEMTVEHWLENKSIVYETQKKFSDCVSSKGKKLRFDFFVPSLNTCIEYDGIQHFRPWQKGDNASLAVTQENDSIKNTFCELKGVSLLRIHYTDFINIDHILTKTLITPNMVPNT